MFSPNQGGATHDFKTNKTKKVEFQDLKIIPLYLFFGKKAMQPVTPAKIILY